MNDLRRMVFLGIVFLLCVSTIGVGEAGESGRNAILVSATISTAPPSITLSWPVINAYGPYTIFRRLSPVQAWGEPRATLSSSANEYRDDDVEIGIQYEYKIYRSSSDERFRGDAYLVAGIDIPFIEYRGTALLLVDETVAESLVADLTRYTSDLVGDGWTVIRHDVPRGISGQAGDVEPIKALILDEYAKNPQGLKAVILFGHIAVPYSGDIFPDGHPEHRGAWPADVYYADMDGTWTDETVSSTSGSYNGWNNDYNGHNHNVPGDGKFDQNIIPSENGVELMLGRIDLWGFEQSQWTSNTKSEVTLLGQYLQKNHNFRHKLFTMPQRGIISDNFPDWGLASDGWVPFSAFFGHENVHDKTNVWLETLRDQSYLFGYACGGGNPYGLQGIGQNNQNCGTKLLIESDQRVVFTMMWGSYFGDWDLPANFLRAPLATETYTLTCSWAGSPHWVHHHMALGETIGYCTKLSQNNSPEQAHGYYFYYPEPKGVHPALMGDPTLRLHPVSPARNPSARDDGARVVITWDAAVDEVIGYLVYWADRAEGPYIRLSPNTVIGTVTVDNDPREGMNYYMIRALTLQTSGSGTYFNLAQGAFCSVGYDDPPDAPALESGGLIAILLTVGFLLLGRRPGLRRQT